MAITADKIKKLIRALGFTPVDGEVDIFHKKYAQHDGYTLHVDFVNKAIEYIDTSFGDTLQITVGSKSTSNFAKDENFVVLECVNRLLEKGYSPSSIELEKVYPSGRGHSGELDILVNDIDGQAFLMIECKTWGKEYDKEVSKMLSSGGQLFTYFKNATSAKSLCLYTSQLAGKEVEYENSIIDVAEDWKSLSETKDIHERWNKVFKKNGIFEEYASPYNIVHKRLTYGDLATMKDEDSRKIFHQIMTILRHNGVSDKPNAFNKLLNLFVCKIIDEDTNGNINDKLQFQCWEALSDEDLQMTLNDLYKFGMKRFLEIDVIDHSQKEVDDVLQVLDGDVQQKQRLMKMFSETRLKKSPNFAFIEVQDEKTFKLNAKIVREIVELLQHFKFRYEQKHEFLGDFFEKMLNTSMKQEAGQFFTPVPITRFIISSMPLRNFVQSKIDSKDPDPLPTVIDYACGSGHFLTEYMSTMQTIVESVDISNAPSRTKGKLNSWRGDVKFSWADEYVYGIDFDNRLVKTAKVSAFFNGDGEATIIWGDGLDSFEHSDVYRGKLKETMLNKQDNGQFDILISNPPYSVESFRRMLKHGKESFELYNGLTDSSKEIECLFVERMKQLLKEDGWVGVILPSSILSNEGIHSRTRSIIFKHFNIKAIAELGSGTFMKTGTNTVILFLERRSDVDCKKVEQAIDGFFANKRDVAVMGIEQAFSTFVANVYDGLSFDDYLSFVERSPNDSMKDYVLYKDYIKELGDNPYNKAFEIEKEKMMYFLLTYNQNIVVVKSGQKKDEKKFLGYEFSERRGHEGIKFLSKGTMLFDVGGDVSNPQKVSSYILNAFLGGLPMPVDESIAKHVSYGQMSSFFEYGTSRFNNKITLRKQSRPLLSTKWENKTIGEICISGRGRVINDEYIESNAGEYPVYSSQTSNDGIFGYIDTYDFEGEYVTWTTDGAKAGSVFYRDGKFNCTNVCGTLKAKIPCEMRYVALVLSKVAPYYVDKKGNDKLMNNVMETIKIPLPPIDIQRQIVNAFENAYVEISTIKESIENAKNSITDKFLEMFGDPVSNSMNWKYEPLSELGELNRGISKHRPRNAPELLGGEHPLIQTGEVAAADLYITSYNSTYSDVGLQQSRKWPKGTLCITIAANIAKTAILDFDACFPDSIVGFIANAKASPIFMHYWFSFFQKAFEEQAPQLAQKNINLQILRKLKVIVPPIELQNEFAEYVNDTIVEIQKIQQSIDALGDRRNEILNKYL